MIRESESLIRRYKEEVWSQGKLDLAEELLAPDFAFYSPGQSVEGREAVVGYLGGLCTVFPNLHVTIQEIIVEDDRAACVFTITGTQQYEFLGFPAQGQQVELPGVNIFQLVGGQLCREQNFWDRQTLLNQLQPVAESA